MEYLNEIIALLAGLIGGATIGSLITIKVCSNSNKVNQSGASSKGDIVGRDKN